MVTFIWVLNDFVVGEVYGQVIGENDANISTLQMLTSIENFFGELLDLQEQLPEDTIAEFEKKLEKDRRARLREEKIKEQEALQRERVRRALERAQGKICGYNQFYYLFQLHRGRMLAENPCRVLSHLV